MSVGDFLTTDDRVRSYSTQVGDKPSRTTMGDFATDVCQDNQQMAVHQSKVTRQDGDENFAACTSQRISILNGHANLTEERQKEIIVQSGR